MPIAEHKLSPIVSLPRRVVKTPGLLARMRSALTDRVAVLSWRQRLALGLMLLAVVLTGFASFIERHVAHQLASHVPLAWTREASRLSLEHLDQTEFSPSQLNAEQQTVLRSHIAALRLPIDQPPPYELLFRHGNKLGATLFTLPGGQIVITDEFIAANPDLRGLTTLIVEQLGHLHFEHALRAQVEHAPFALIMALMRDDAQAGIRLLGDAPPKLIHDPECIAEARDFAAAVMRINP